MTTVTKSDKRTISYVLVTCLAAISLTVGCASGPEDSRAKQGAKSGAAVGAGIGLLLGVLSGDSEVTLEINAIRTV